MAGGVYCNAGITQVVLLIKMSYLVLKNGMEQNWTEECSRLIII